MIKFSRRHYLTTVLLGGAFALLTSDAKAQGRDRGHENDNRGHDNDHDDHSNYRFRPEDRSHFASHYQKDLRQWQQHPDKRHHISPGAKLPSDYRSRLKAVPSSYYRTLPPPPPGYRFGYYDGYVVAYNPTTQIVADVLDLVNAAVNH
jgi:Ni/Co efflux regulator RcnB